MLQRITYTCLKTIALILLISGSVSIKVSAQSIVADSLKDALVHAGSDEQRFDLVSKLAIELRFSHLDSALFFARQALQLAIRMQNVSAEAEALISIGEILHYPMGWQDSSAYYAERAIELTISSEEQQLLADAYNVLAKVYQAKSLHGKSNETFDKVLELSQNLQNRNQYFYTLNQIGKNHMYSGQHEEADKYYQQAIDVAKELDNKIYEAGILQNLGNNAAMWNKLEKAVAYYNQAIVIHREISDQESEARMLRMIAYTYLQNGYYPLSLEFYQQTLGVAEEAQNNRQIGLTYKGMGNVYKEMGEMDKALEFYQKAFKSEFALQNKYEQASIQNEIGRMFFIKEQYDSALVYFFNARDFLIRNNFESDPHDYQRIGNAYERMGRLDSAQTYLKYTVDMADRRKSVHFKAKALIDLADVLQQIGNVTASITALEEVLGISAETGQKQEELEARKLLYQIFKQENDVNKALFYHETYKEIEDSLFNDKNSRQIARIEAKAEFEREKQQLAFEQEQELASHRTAQRFTVIALLVVVVLMAVIVWSYRQKQKANVELRKLNQEIRDQKAELIALDSLKSNFFANVSHELRTPLTLIIGPVEAALKQQYGEVSDRLNFALQNMQRNSKKLLTLVEEILDLSKLESGKMTVQESPVHFRSYIKRIFASFESLAEINGIRYWIDYELEDDLYLMLDKDKVEKILFNLLSNAIKFTPKNGSIYMLVSKVANSNNVRIKVRDTGEGIAKEDLPHIFERFFQTKNPRASLKGGTGIGLALSYEFAQIMGGTLEVESKQKEGSTFILELPLKEARKPENILISTEGISPVIYPEIQPSVQAPENAPTLLLVEDNLDMQQFIVSILSTHFKIITANNGKEALKVLSSSSSSSSSIKVKSQAMPNDPELAQTISNNAKPSLIISDVMMPEMDGFTLLNKLKANKEYAYLPIIMLTARAGEQDKLHALRVGVDDYLTKPFLPEELLARVQNLILHANERQQIVDRPGPSPKKEPVSAVELDKKPKFSQRDIDWLKKLEQVTLEVIENADFHLSYLEEELAVSSSQLNRKIKALTGLTPNQYIREARLHKARQLLEEYRYSSLAEYAHAVGFKDPHYFSTLFEKRFGKKVKDYFK